MVAVQKTQEVLTLNNLAYIIMCVQDFSKILMYDFHYNYIKDGKKSNITDTDSLVYEIEMNDVYKNFYRNKYMFDFSEYQKNSKF